MILVRTGGRTRAERSATSLIAQGWRPARLASTTLRFETAGIAGGRASCRNVHMLEETLTHGRRLSVLPDRPTGDSGAARLFESPDCVAFRDINPQAPTHILVVPREHVASLNDATDAALLGKLVARGGRDREDGGDRRLRISHGDQHERATPDRRCFTSTCICSAGDRWRGRRADRDRICLTAGSIRSDLSLRDCADSYSDPSDAQLLARLQSDLNAARKAQDKARVTAARHHHLRRQESRDRAQARRSPTTT